MKSKPVVLMALGTLVFLAGLVFMLQGDGIVGPNSSFMFQNATWVAAGDGLMIVGAAVWVVALFIARTHGP